MVERLECPICFKCWEEGGNEFTVHLGRLKEKKCKFCKVENPSGEVLLHRMFEVMGNARVTNLPNILALIYELCKNKTDNKRKL